MIGVEAATLRAPFPWAGGKMRAAGLIWPRFGSVASYVEPFAGSLAVLLQRPEPWSGSETINDADGFVCNFWRALAADPEAVADAALWPVNELDLTARHLRLVERRAATTAALEADPDFYDARSAGWWAWGLSCWIGFGWCSGAGPWVRDGMAVVRRGTAGQGVRRKLPHLGTAGQGVHRKLPHLGNDGRGVRDWLAALSARLRRVRVCCGDWSRVCTPTVLRAGSGAGPKAVLLDPPYPEGFDPDGTYATGGADTWHEAAAWAVEAGRDRSLRIALCGYAGTWTPPDGWAEVAWKTAGGYGGGRGGDGEANRHRERIWFSPACLRPDLEQGRLFAQTINTGRADAPEPRKEET